MINDIVTQIYNEMAFLPNKYDKLTKSEAIKLSKFLRAKHGNLHIALTVSGLSPLTIKRAIALMQIKHETAEKIRVKILKEL